LYELGRYSQYPMHSHNSVGLHAPVLKKVKEKKKEKKKGIKKGEGS
jgi:hypothetical protein